MTSNNLSAPEDPFTQPVTLLMPDGSQFNVTMDQFAWFHSYGVRWGITVGTAIGATFVMLLALALLSKPEKRRSPIFVLNILALALDLIRQTLSAVYIAGPFQNPYPVISNDWDRITAGDKATSIAIPVMKLLDLIVIELSLLLQVQVVLATAHRIHRFWLMMACCTIGLISLGFQFAFMVVNCQYIIDLKPQWDNSFQSLADQSDITIMISLCLFTLIFVAKLGYAIFQRRRLGIRKFGPMQIVFIMGLQTLIVPTIIGILQYCTTIPEIQTQFLTLVALSLPLSSLWAATSIENVSNPIHVKPIVMIPFGSSKSPENSSFSDMSTGHSGCFVGHSTVKYGDEENTTKECMCGKTWEVPSNQP